MYGKWGHYRKMQRPWRFNRPVFAMQRDWFIQAIANIKRIVNKVLVDLDPYPMPRIDHLFNNQKRKHFASLYLRSRYWQIEIKWDPYKTALIWKDQCYQYTHLAFCLASAGQIFSQCIAEALFTVNHCDNILFYIEDNSNHTRMFDEFILVL